MILSENRKSTFRDHALSGHDLVRKPGNRFSGSCPVWARSFRKPGSRFSGSCPRLRIAPSSCPRIFPGPTGLSPKRRRRPRVAKHSSGQSMIRKSGLAVFRKDHALGKTKAVIPFGITALDPRRARFLGGKTGGVKRGRIGVGVYSPDARSGLPPKQISDPTHCLSAWCHLLKSVRAPVAAGAGAALGAPTPRITPSRAQESRVSHLLRITNRPSSTQANAIPHFTCNTYMPRPIRRRKPPTIQ
jgi:hypothetical protein